MECKLHTCICTWILTAALFIRVKKWKQFKCPSNDEWIKKCHMSIQWNIIQPQRGMKYWYILYFMDETWNHIMLNEGSRSQKTIHYMIPFILNIQNRQIYRDLWISGCQGQGKRGWENWAVTANRYGVSFVCDKNVLRMNVVMVARLFEYTKRRKNTTELYTLRGWIL